MVVSRAKEILVLVQYIVTDTIHILYRTPIKVYSKVLSSTILEIQSLKNPTYICRIIYKQDINVNGSDQT